MYEKECEFSWWNDNKKWQWKVEDFYITPFRRVAGWKNEKQFTIAERQDTLFYKQLESRSSPERFLRFQLF